MDFSVWMYQISMLIQTKPLFAAVIGAALLLLLYWQSKLFIKLMLACAVILVVIYILSSVTNLTSKGVENKNDLIREER